MTFLYFAFGSNMLTERLVARCPSAKVIGAASVATHTLSFLKPSKDSSGKATLMATDPEGLHTPGMLFEVSQTDRGNLDKAEGADYDRHDRFQVWSAETGEKVTVTTYIAAKIKAGLRPFDWYLALVIAGACQHGLGHEHVQRLRLTEYDVDPDPKRLTRIEALRVLQLAGHDDYKVLLIDGN